ncbi:MAG: DUF2274 domain-containing protein [Phenylobacterium sp.]|nr:DUF2274 domain-containing protein [Phenylobacterium sp.]
MAKTPSTTLALPRIDIEEKLLDVRVRLKGKAALDLADYQRAYAATTGDRVEPEALVVHILAAFIEGDKGFQAWRKANPAPDARG